MDIKKTEQKNICFHYNTDPIFFGSFLGKTLCYSSGYYTSKNTVYDKAQHNKLDLICSKLNLQKGESFLDIGCGWGELIIYAAKKYKVQAKGITISDTQYRYIQNRIKKENLEKHCHVSILNYRDLEAEKYSKISCVEVEEHITTKYINDFYQTIHKSLKTDGLFLSQVAISKSGFKKGLATDFREKYIFPGGELLKLQDIITAAWKSNMELVSSENMTDHYILTMSEWIKKMQAKQIHNLTRLEKIQHRALLIFWAGCLLSYKNRQILLFQNLFSKK
jgi:cyclopropane-fatty-acyl-phospholipid synthase